MGRFRKPIPAHRRYNASMLDREPSDWLRVRRRGLIALAAVALCSGPGAIGDVPLPSETPAEVVVSGRTSTVRDVKVVCTGEDVPKTFAAAALKNTPRFAWYVSRHYALKTDYPEPKARYYLTLLELAYPHYVELFGREPDGLDRRRMAAVYASSKARLAKALLSDGIVWDFSGGGVTFESGYNCAYVYPSGSLAYHQRYILLHEVTHLFQMALAGTVHNTPEWFYEGLADAMASHVYDSGAGRLTLRVLDKPTTINFLDEGLRGFRKNALTFEGICKGRETLRGQNVLVAHFFLSDPERAQKFRLLRDEMMPRGGHDRAHSSKLLQELFGPWPRVNAAFAAWRGRLQSTFHYAEWGWEQEADTLWSYGYAEKGRLSRTNVYLAPGERPEHAPFRMDYPLQPPSPLVGPVQRGTAEPSVGCLVDFSRNPRSGRAGLGMGLVEEASAADGGSGDTFLKVLIEKEAQLVIDGTDLGMGLKSFDFPRSFRQAAEAGGHRIGMTVKIASAGLEVVLRAGRAEAPRLSTFRAAVPIDEARRRRLLRRGLAILARDGSHGVTPYVDDRRRPEPDLAVPAPANPWRNPGDGQLWMLYRAAGRLGGKAPRSLLSLKQRMLAAVTKAPAAQREALAAFDKGVGAVLKDIQACGADRKAVGLATMDIGRAIALREPDGD